ncbi:hypothetical protein K493DRAFT_341147 [Basidiobolus meristosporus CBS 931.73]|uniref:Uncharacterized protein n=1 Tax=Basidiobolus meristosporus CBS 931.73 TaxID=1314790 RepID=A0A1Y1XTP9_9FUNG|nr:hypothetical protein K493DRAFT_341147 [Basidiobolus meristosporus CBS 931.73]|eukprot:ORX88674.1 hypothetical protein K493DRAFT_341147 [Basidiobolus meristosporus CBS 931.73]
MSYRRQYIESSTAAKNRISSKEALLLSQYSNIMANLDSLTLKQDGYRTTKRASSIPLPNKQITEKLAVNQVVDKFVSASLSRIAHHSNGRKAARHEAPFDGVELDFPTVKSPYDISPVDGNLEQPSFDALNNIPLATFSYHEIPFEDEDLLPNYTQDLPCSPPPPYPSSEYPFMKQTPSSDAPRKEGWLVLVEARKAMCTKFPPTQVLYTKYVNELMNSRPRVDGRPSRISTNTRRLVKDPHGICWPLRGERRNRKYHFDNFLPPRISGAREIRSNKDQMRIMALEASMQKADKISTPLRSRFSLPKRAGKFTANIPSRLRNSSTLEDLVWETYYDELNSINTAPAHKSSSFNVLNFDPDA